MGAVREAHEHDGYPEYGRIAGRLPAPWCGADHGAVLGVFAVTAVFEGVRTTENAINTAQLLDKPLVGLTEIVLACAMIATLILRPRGLIGTVEVGELPIFRRWTGPRRATRPHEQSEESG